MPSCNQVTNVVREEFVAGAGRKGFFRRIAERMGLAQKEVAECRGKSLSEMAEMTSKKDVVEIAAKENNTVTKQAISEKLDVIRKELDKVTKEIERQEKILSDYNDFETKLRSEITKYKTEAKVLDTSSGHYDTDIERFRPNYNMKNNQNKYDAIMKIIKSKEESLSKLLADIEKKKVEIKDLKVKRENLYQEHHEKTQDILSLSTYN